MSDTDEPEREPKKYCCGNSPQNEAGYVSKCDMGIACYLLLGHILVTVLTFTSPDTIKNYVDKNPLMRDLKKLCAADIQYQIIFLLFSFSWLVFELSLAIFLFLSSKKRDKLLLKKWFNATVTDCLCGIAVALTGVYFLDEKVYISVFATIYYLYKWYGLWIVQELRNEIKSGVNPYAIPNHF